MQVGLSYPHIAASSVQLQTAGLVQYSWGRCQHSRRRILTIGQQYVSHKGLHEIQVQVLRSQGLFEFNLMHYTIFTDSFCIAPPD